MRKIPKILQIYRFFLVKIAYTQGLSQFDIGVIFNLSRPYINEILKKKVSYEENQFFGELIEFIKKHE